MIKLDVISGFLGVGKTTFANLLLRYYMDPASRMADGSPYRPVYIVNEFGQTGLDADIIKADGFEAIEMPGGCICCTLKTDVGVAIVNVMDAYSPTHIVFEPSGIFVFDNFFDVLRQDNIKNRCEVGDVFTIVDSVNFSFSKLSHTYGSFIYNQIKNAPILILSKLEKTKHNVEELICDIKNINPDALVMSKIWANWDKADFERMLNHPKVFSYTDHDSEETLEYTQGRHDEHEHDHDHDHDHDHHDEHHHHDHHHDDLFSVTIIPEEHFTQERIDSLIANCKSGVFGDLYRIKGIILKDDQHLLLNIAMEDVDLTEFNSIQKPTLTFIGKTVNEEEILKFFKK